MKKKLASKASSISSRILLVSILLFLLGSGGLIGQEKPKEPAKPAPARPAAKPAPARPAATPAVKVASVDPKLMRAPSSVVLGETMTLRNTTGQEIEARLLSASGEFITIERVEDTRRFEIPISTLDDFTADRIRQWMETSPKAVNFSLSIESSKSLSNASSFMNIGREFKTSEWTYRVSITNLTRNVLSGAQVEYRVIYDDAVDVSRGSALPGKGIDQQEGQIVDLPDMVFNDQVEFETLPVKIDNYEYIPTTRGAPREFSRDSLRGIWVRVIKNGEVIAEYQSSPASLARTSWDNENRTEIRLKNNFRSQFGAQK